MGDDSVPQVRRADAHPDAPPPSEGGYRFPPANQVWNIKLADWEKYQETFPREWKEIFEKR